MLAGSDLNKEPRETAKKNGLEPYAYLRHLFENLPLAKTEQDLKAIMPRYIDPKVLPSPTAC